MTTDVDEETGIEGFPSRVGQTIRSASYLFRTSELTVKDIVLQTYVPRIASTVDLFVSQVAKQNGPIDATAWTNFLSFDIMGKVGFGKDFGGVAKGEEHPAIKGVHDHMNILGIVSHLPWLLNIASRIPGATAGYAPFFNWCASEIIAKQKVRGPGLP
jgi:hypothetical protein